MAEEAGYARFAKLYGPWASSLIQWSEGGGVLEPRFMQLHERDIGRNIGDYNLWRYVGAFVASLGELRTRIKRLVFCYSFENRSFLPPGECELRYFYYYQFSDVATLVAIDHDPPQSWKDKLKDRPEPVEIRTDLAKALQGCHWVQPYMLRAPGNKELISFHQLSRWTPETLRKMLEAHTKEVGAYQFSICGYEMLEEYEEPSESEKMLLELSYLVHAWNWNHDLNATHKLLRRVVTRTAAVGVMGRNMSHNIGSHVLARYANELGRERRDGSKGASQANRKIPAEDHRAAFLRYLQRRMDFIAEVSTAESSFWSQSLNLGAVLRKLDFDFETERINVAGSTKFKPILLSHVSGREGTPASVIRSACMDNVYFSAPGGEVGVHALYVILENIIRNSARHNAGAGDPIRIEVDVEPAGDLWKLTIVDRGTHGREDLPKTINTIMEDPLVERDGKISPKYWGIREMQICAHYLRHISLSELGEPADGLPVLEAVLCRTKDGGAFLGYVLYLTKPKTCAIVATRDVPGLPIAAGTAELAPGIRLFVDIEDVQDLRGYDFVLAAYGALPLKDRSERLILPVRTTEIHRRLTEKLIRWIQRYRTDPMRLVEWLNEFTWRNYHHRRKHWRNKRRLDALVAWVGLKQSPIRREHFLHATKGPKEKEYQNFAAISDVRNGPDRLCLAWIDHANSEDFEGHSVPNLASACQHTGDDTSCHIVFAEAFDSLSPHTAELEKHRRGSGRGNELIAAALARVVVLDERVQTEYEETYRGIPYRILWPCMGVWVPPRDAGVDLNKHPTFDGIRAFLSSPTELEEQLPIDILVIHLTLLENLRRQRDLESEQETLDLLCAGTQIAPTCEIVAISGRGVPSARLGERTKSTDKLQVRYQPVSALLEHVVVRPSKLALMRLLWSATAVTETRRIGP